MDDVADDEPCALKVVVKPDVIFPTLVQTLPKAAAHAESSLCLCQPCADAFLCVWMYVQGSLYVCVADNTLREMKFATMWRWMSG